MYRRAYDAKRKVFSELPLDDWAAHGADGIRYVVQSTPYAAPRLDWQTPIRRNLRVVV
jgi:hypothetical protein